MKLFLVKRKLLTLGACLLCAVAMFYIVNHPAIVGAAATTRQLPIYCVQRDQKVVALSFDAAWGDVIIRPLGPSGSRKKSAQAAAKPPFTALRQTTQGPNKNRGGRCWPPRRLLKKSGRTFLTACKNAVTFEYKSPRFARRKPCCARLAGHSIPFEAGSAPSSAPA